ncbi:MAG: putative rane protein [Herbinix sp.]|nr:putative rane protein [Herbinix sp.]
MSEMNNNMMGRNAAETFEPADIEKNKTMAGLGIIIFFLPLIACPESKFGRFYANQGLLLFILGVGGSIILSLIPFIGWFLLPFFSIATLVLAIIGLINGLGGKAKELPLIGRFRLIK